MQTIEQRLREEEWLIFEWSPIHLRKLLSDYYFKEGSESVSALKVWQDSCHYLYMPRLLNDTVYKEALGQGLSSRDYFGYASGKEGDRYLGFVFGQSSLIQLNNESLLIEREIAHAYSNRIFESREENTTEIIGQPIIMDVVEGVPETTGVKPLAVTHADNVNVNKSSFYGTVELDSITATMQFAKLMEEVVQQFTSKLGVDVTISVEISATDKQAGFSESLQRSVKENCNVLNFENAEFE